MLPRLSQLLLAALALSGVVSASPSNDEEVRAFIAREAAAVKPVNFGRRSAATTPTRHLRPERRAAPVKRDITPPDVGQVADFGNDRPQPIRNGIGDTYLAQSNEEIDRQNPDNLAAPPTDAGERTSPFFVSSSRTALTPHDRRCCPQFEVEHVAVAHAASQSASRFYRIRLCDLTKGPSIGGLGTRANNHRFASL